jgi:uncharacterized membrane protein YfcA
MSLAVVGATSLFGAVGHWRAGNVNLRVAAIFGVVAMAGTYLGARLAVFFSGAAQLTLFAVVMVLAAFFMFRSKKPPVLSRSRGTEPDRARVPPCHSERERPLVIPSERSESRNLHFRAGPGHMPLALIVVEGIAVGILTGLVGVGGGFLIVPALVLLGKLPMKQAVGTSLLVIAMKSGAGLAGYLGQVEVDWAFMGLFTAVSIGGIFLGTWLVRFVPQRELQRAFAVFLLVMGGFILYQNRGVVMAGHETPVSTAVARH